MPRKVGKKKVSSTDNFEGAFNNFPKIMESTDLQSSFDPRDKIKLEEEVNIQDLVLSTDETMEMVNVKEEMIDGDTLVHEGTKDFSSSHEWNELLKLEMKNKISKLFEKFDMMSLHDYDLMRVEKTQQLFERYLKEQTKNFEVKEIFLKAEFFTLMQEFENSINTNLRLQQKIHEYEIADGKMPCENGARICDENMSTQNQNIHEQKKDHNSFVHENKKPKKDESSPSMKQESVETNPNKFKKKKKY
jgi:hypothetical protein